MQKGGSNGHFYVTRCWGGTRQCWLGVSVVIPLARRHLRKTFSAICEKSIFALLLVVRLKYFCRCSFFFHVTISCPFNVLKCVTYNINQSYSEEPKSSNVCSRSHASVRSTSYFLFYFSAQSVFTMKSMQHCSVPMCTQDGPKIGRHIVSRLLTVVPAS